ncbi:hypothetical protein BC941DRAFT_429357 [Chlamydoabsidia padenii]|nr:hypothetical protein BC941DRAFT_429357 [Chlamydoabsidia padenii]
MDHLSEKKDDSSNMQQSKPDGEKVDSNNNTLEEGNNSVTLDNTTVHYKAKDTSSSENIHEAYPKESLTSTQVSDAETSIPPSESTDTVTTAPRETHDTVQPQSVNKSTTSINEQEGPIPIVTHTADDLTRQQDPLETPPRRITPPLDHEYLVKSIDWLDPNTNTSRVVRIITQNENGPCPLVSICNVLFIRGDLNMRPFEREKVTFEYLLEILGDYLLNHAPPDIKTPEMPPLSSSPPSILPTNQQQEPLTRQSTMEYVLTYRHNLDMALTILPRLQTGLDVNVQFSSIHDFEPTAELALFDLFNVDLVHGWIIDPQDEEGYRVMNQCKSYNGVVECIVRGNESVADAGNNDDDRESKIHDGLVASQFLEDTATQLTYYGIALLTDALPKNKLCVLFRNNHFSTLYKHPITDKLYTLVTDSGLVSELNIVWETLGDIDQGSSEFVNSQFTRPPPARITETSSSDQHNNQETEDLE